MKRLRSNIFGQENPVGKQIKITYNDTSIHSFIVGGVGEKRNPRASFSYNILINFDKVKELGLDMNDWDKWIRATFIQVNDPNDLASIKEGMGPMLASQNEANSDWQIQEFRFENLYDLANTSFDTNGDISNGIHPASSITLTIIAVFLLLLACFNYVNISIASAARRIKEIGIRKVMGGNRGQLIGQFIGENLLLCIISLLFGIALAEFFFVPGFNSAGIMGGNELTLEYGANLSLWLFFGIMLLITGIGAGAYPALYISSFQPVHIFSGKLKMSRKNVFTRSLLTLQFVLSFILLIAGVVFTQNAEYQKNIDWGYNQDQVISVRINGKGNFEPFYQKVKQNPNIAALAGSRSQIGRGNALSVVEYEGKKHEIQRFDIGYDYLETMSLRLESGRSFDRKMGLEENNIVINQTFARFMEWDKPLGEQVKFDSTLFTVIGVVEDFHYDSFFDEIRPSMLRIIPDDKFLYLSVRAKAGTATQTNDYLKSEWTELVPSVPYQGDFQDEAFENFHRENQGIKNIFVVVAIIALILSSMGLFGLVSLNVARRMKEFSIRKVLGASMYHVTKLVNREFMYLLIIAVVISIPISYILLNQLLDSVFKYHVNIDAIPYILAISVILGTSLVTVSSQLYKVSKANPVDALRDE